MFWQRGLKVHFSIDAAEPSSAVSWASLSQTHKCHWHREISYDTTEFNSYQVAFKGIIRKEILYLLTLLCQWHHGFNIVSNFPTNVCRIQSNNRKCFSMSGQAAQNATQRWESCALINSALSGKAVLNITQHCLGKLCLIWLSAVWERCA